MLPDPQRRRALIREALGQTHPTSADFEALCLDYFPEVAGRITSGMERKEQENLLFRLVSDDEQLMQALYFDQPSLISRKFAELIPSVVTQSQSDNELLPAEPASTYTPPASPQLPDLIPDYAKTKVLAEVLATIEHVRAVQLHGPANFGKTSLLIKALHDSQRLGYHAYYVDIRTANDGHGVTVHDHFKSIAAELYRQLGLLPVDALRSFPKIGGSPEAGLKRAMSAAFRSVIDAVPSVPAGSSARGKKGRKSLLVGVDHVDHSIYGRIDGTQLVSAFRSFTNGPFSHKGYDVKLILCTSSVGGLLTDSVYRSPNNIGERIEVSSLEDDEVANLARKVTRAELAPEELRTIRTVLGNHPAMVAKLCRIARVRRLRVGKLLQETIEHGQGGIFATFIDDIFEITDKVLLGKYLDFLKTRSFSANVTNEDIFRLKKGGLISGSAGQHIPFCELYRKLVQK